MKLASELQKRSTGRTIYVLDEPTTGLHFEDVSKLLGVLQSLVDKGNSVLVIEHNLDVIKTADWVIDMGPEGGSGGGTVVAEGTPEQVAMVPARTPAGSWPTCWLTGSRPAGRRPTGGEAGQRPRQAAAAKAAAGQATGEAQRRPKRSGEARAATKAAATRAAAAKTSRRPRPRQSSAPAKARGDQDAPAKGGTGRSRTGRSGRPLRLSRSSRGPTPSPVTVAS